MNHPSMKKFSFSLRKEIFLVLLVKLGLILILWGLCFQHPIEENLTDQAIAKHVLE
jgi:hypothetical protein